MASIDDLKSGNSRTGTGIASGTDDGDVLVIGNPNIKGASAPENHLDQEGALVIENPNVAEQSAKKHEFSGDINIDDLSTAGPVKQQSSTEKSTRHAADLSSLPKDTPAGVENVHESIEADVFKPGGAFDQYKERKLQEFNEVNDLIDQHNAMVAAERGVPVPTDEELEEMGKRGEATNNLTAVLQGTKYEDVADNYGRAKGELKGTALEERMKHDPELKEKLYGTAVEDDTDTTPNLLDDDEDEYMDDLEKEIEAEMGLEEEVTPVVKTVEPTVEVTPVVEKKQVVTENKIAEAEPAKSTSEFNFDDEDFDTEPDPDETAQEDSITSIEEVDPDENMKQFQASITEKIRPVNQKLNRASFRVVKTPVSISTATLQAEEQLQETDGTNRFQTLKNRYKLIYDHVISQKPESLEAWLKSISFNDADHIFFAAYGAAFAGSHYVPYDCDKCKNTFLSENFPIESLYKYKDDAAKEKCEKLRQTQDGATPGTYVSEAIQISDNFAISFREPSLWNAVFENAILDEKFADKYRSVLAAVMYIDEIWKIGDGVLNPIAYKIDRNNMAKTVKARVITYAKIISTLTADQYNVIMAYLAAINQRNDDITYIRPEVMCPNCGTVIPETETTGQELLFTRSQLAALSLTSIS